MTIANKAQSVQDVAMRSTRLRQGKFSVILRKEAEGGYSVQCLELPGAISQGENRREALANIREAIQGYLEAFPEEAEQLRVKPEVVEVSV